MKCCCNCRGDGWIKCAHFFLTLTILYIQLVNGRSDLHNAWVDQSCCYVYMFFVLLFVSSFFYVTASVINPGYLAKNLNHQERSIPEHQQQKISNDDTVTGEVAKETSVSRYCRVCCTIQPMRTKHCYMCGRCVRKFDHHCPWLGNCVGERNHKFFWLFLLTESLLLVWAIKITWSSLQWHMSLEHWVKANALDLICFFVVTVATVGTIMLLVYHTYLMLTGQTTWEQVSRHRIMYLKDLEVLTNPFDEGCCKNLSVFLCNCRHVGRNWETIYSKGVYR